MSDCQTGQPVGMGVFIVLLYFSIYLKGIIITDHVSAFPHLARTLILVNLGTRYFWWSGQWHKLSSCGIHCYCSELK